MSPPPAHLKELLTHAAWLRHDNDATPRSEPTIWNATLNYHFKPEHSTLFLTVKNLADKTYIVDRTRGILPGSPRLVQAGLKYNF